MTADVIIPFHGRAGMLIDCTRPLFPGAAMNCHRIVLADDCSPLHEVKKLQQAIPGNIPVTLMRLPLRTGFVGAVNYAWAKCRGNMAVVLNSDTLPGPHLMQSLIEVLESNPEIAAVGPASDNKKDLFQFRKQACTNDPNRQHGQYSFTDYLTGVCLAVRRSAIRGPLLFDPAYAPGYFEDLDLCCRLRQQGWKLAILETERLHHAGAATFGDEPALENILLNNCARFVRQWGHLPQHPNLDLLSCQ